MRTFFITGLVFLGILHCKTYTIINNNSTYTQLVLTDQKIQFLIPNDWVIFYSSKKFFQLYAKENNSVYGPMLEYRGLPNSTRSRSERELYASGWYKAINLNYPKWNYEAKNYNEIDFQNKKIYSYEFIGTFMDGSTRLKKLGYLRFFEDRIHAIYYTCSEEDFEKCKVIFQKIDEAINYSPSIPPY